LRRSNLQPGCLLTREERWQLRLDADDLTRRIERASPEQVDSLQRQLGSVTREQLADRQTRPKRSAKKGRS
jgi:hypothetical protein